MANNIMNGAGVHQLEYSDDVYTDKYGVACALGYDSVHEVSRAFARRGLAKTIAVEVDGKTKRLFPIESILTLAFLSDRAERADEWKNLASDAVNDVLRYGFYIDPSLSAGPEIRIAIIEHVTRKRYIELARSRFKPEDKYFGSMLRGAYFTAELLKRPESYLHAHEVKEVRAIEAAAVLLHRTMELEPEHLLNALGIRPMHPIREDTWARWSKFVEGYAAESPHIADDIPSIIVRPDKPEDEPGLMNAHLPTLPDFNSVEQLYLERGVKLDIPDIEVDRAYKKRRYNKRTTEIDTE